MNIPSQTELRFIVVLGNRTLFLDSVSNRTKRVVVLPVITRWTTDFSTTASFVLASTIYNIRVRSRVSELFGLTCVLVFSAMM